jgi:hypothetical protein
MAAAFHSLIIPHEAAIPVASILGELKRSEIR